MDERTLRHIRLVQGHTGAEIRRARQRELHFGQRPREIDAMRWERALRNYPLKNPETQRRLLAIVERWREEITLKREIAK